ncbi:MAG: glycosyltransferase family 9 protein, partial [Phycisphaerales bacterium]|nr:glycosyltransferase family 9 protein [Phycisphaerales bacterium]
REEALSRLAGQVRDTIVVCMLTGRDATPHRRLEQLGAERVISIDPRPTGERRHITAQWESAFRAQSSHAVSQCVAERRARGLRADPALQETGVERYSKIGFAQPPILIHPGSGGGSKCWPGACFQRVASDLSDRMPKTPIAFLIGPVELETWAPEGIAAFEAIAPIFLCDDPAELAHLLAATPLLIGNDSGPSHLAALLGTPTLTLFGATDAVVWRPFGLRAETIAGDAQMGPHWGLAPDVVVEHATRIING